MTAKGPLKIAIATSGHTAALKNGTVPIQGVEANFVEVVPIIAAFRRMVRDVEFDVCELAPTTYLIARARGAPYIALPIFVMRRFHHGGFVVRPDADITAPKDPTEPSGKGCIFCDFPAENEDEKNLIVHRGERAYVILNGYPYNNGHLMVVPNRHIPSLAAATSEELCELIELTRRAELALIEAYSPHGMNMGINLGKPAGAGILDHVHMHVVPRWNGDTNFMTVVGRTRVLPEELPDTAAKLRPVFARIASR